MLEKCLSNDVVPDDSGEFLQVIANRIDPTISTYTYIVPLFGVKLDGIDEIILGTLKIVSPSKELIETLSVKYSAKHLDLALEQMKPYLWPMGATQGTAIVSRERFVAKSQLAAGLLATVAASQYEYGSQGFRIGAITAPEEGHGRAVSLSWADTDGLPASIVYGNLHFFTPPQFI